MDQGSGTAERGQDSPESVAPGEVDVVEMSAETTSMF